MGKKARQKGKSKQRVPYVARTFEGLPAEGDWIALREFVPAGSGLIALADGSTVRVCSMLPGYGAGLRRPDGQVWIGLQVQHTHGDISRDLAHTIESAQQVAPGEPIPVTDPGAGGPRVQNIIASDSTFDVEVYDSFDYWLTGTDDEGTDLLAAANDSIAPTERLSSVAAGYWTRMGDRQYLRWVVTEDENRVLDAFARLAEAGQERLSEDTRLIGMFRAHGLLVPVWEIGPSLSGGATPLEAPVAELSARLDTALADTSELSTAQRSIRSGLASRQVTIR